MTISDFINKITNTVNRLIAIVNAIQEDVGLISDTGTEGTIHGRVYELEQTVGSSGSTGTSVSRMMVDKNVVISDDTFELSYIPLGGFVINDQVLINNEDSTQDIWEGVSFNEELGTLVGANGEHDGKSLIATYIYAFKDVIEEYVYDSAEEELVKDFYDLFGLAYKVIIEVTEVQDTVELKWENSNDDTDVTTDSITDDHTRVLYDDELIYKMYVTGTCNVKLTIMYKVG